jgi:uncharacterized membrane protein YjfL (UPF0719 family)
MDMEFARATSVMLGVNLLYAILAMVLTIVTLKVIDVLFLRKIDLEEEIKKGNLAAALFAAALVIASAIIISKALGK